MVEVQFRNSERSSFTTCHQKWWWGYVDRLKPREQRSALRFGTLVHTALETFYLPGLKRGPRPAETFERLFTEDEAAGYAEGVRDEDGVWHEMGNLGVVMLTEYFNLYGKDTRWYVVGTEAPFRVPTSDRKTGHKFTVVGVVDGLWADRASPKLKRTAAKLVVPYRDLWVADHKTTTKDPTKNTEALIMDEQPGTYWSYGVDYYRMQGIIRPDQPLAGMLFNFLRKGMPDDRPRNEDGHYLNKPAKAALQKEYARLHDKDPARGMTVDDLIQAIGPEAAALLGEVSKVQPAPLFHREPVYRYAADGEAVRHRTEVQARHMRYMRAGKMEVVKSPGNLFQNHCSWCEFKDMCQLHEQGADWESYRDAMFSRWDPYAQHEIIEGR